MQSQSEIRLTVLIFFAEIAQLVEHNLAKVGVASSSLVFRSSFSLTSVGLFSYISVGGAIFVYISWLCCFGVAVLPFRSVLDFAAKFRKIGRKEGDFGGLFTPTFTPVGIGTLRLLIL